MMPRIPKLKVLVVAALPVLFLPSKTVIALSVAAPALSNKPATIDDDDDSKLIEVERAMIEFHASEVAGGKETFAEKHTSGDATALSSSAWGDDAFIGRHFGENYAGMDATYLPKNGNIVFESVSPVLSVEECSFIVEEARETILQGLIEERAAAAAAARNNENESSSPEEQPQQTSSHSISNSQLGEARLSNMPKTRDWLKETLPTRFYPLLKDRFGVDDLVLYDGLVMGNHAPTRSQPIHRDASLLTLNVALSASSDFDGGGTYIEALDEILQIDKGHLLCHAGSAMHAGNAISRGERWVFVLFLLGEHQPQLARRCHAKAIEHMRLQQFGTAETYLRTGLKSIAPHHDHLLHSSLGRVHIAKGDNPSKSFESFRLADTAYPICQNALVSMAQLLIDQRRPRAALRRLDEVLERIQNRDLNPSNPTQMSLKALAYGSRRDAARCALICADYLYSRRTTTTTPHDDSNSTQEDDGSSSSQKQQPSSTWSLRHLPIAIDRLKICLTAAPNEPSLLGMLDRAEYLYVEAVQSDSGGRSK